MPNPDALIASVNITAVAEADECTFRWNPGLTRQTLSKGYAMQHRTTATLAYDAGRYVETISDSDLPTLVTFSTNNSAVIAISETGRLQALSNAMSPVELGAAFCDGQAVRESAYSNLYRQAPVDYDLDLPPDLRRAANETHRKMRAAGHKDID